MSSTEACCSVAMDGPPKTSVNKALPEETNVKEMVHVQRLACVLRRVLPRKGRTLIAVDEVDGSGKTPLAIGLAECSRATVVSIDCFLNRNRGRTSETSVCASFVVQSPSGLVLCSSKG